MNVVRLRSVAVLATLVVGACNDAVGPGDPHTEVPRFNLATGANTSPACSALSEVDLIADFGLPVGTIGVQNSGEMLYVTYSTLGGWTLDRTALSVTDGVEGIPTNRAGNPTIGQFPYKTNHASGTESYSYAIPLDDLASDGLVVVAAYATVVKDKGSEGAWGAGEPVGQGGSWASWFEAEITDCESEEIGGSGGSLSFEGVSLTVDPGALTRDVVITVVPIDLEDLELPLGGSAPAATDASAVSSLDVTTTVQIGSVVGFQGTGYDFGPDGLQFDPPATITIEYDEAAVLAAGFQEEQLGVFAINGIFFSLASVVDAENDRVSASVPHFSSFFLGVKIADLEVSQLYEPAGPGKVGEALEFGADVHNRGPGSITGATFNWVAFGDVALDGLFGLCTEIATPPVGDVAIECPVDPLQSGETDGIPVFRLLPLGTGPLEVWGTVGSPIGAVDVVGNNNRLTANLEVEAAVVADLTVSRLSEPAGPAKVGQLLEYGADVQNLGPDAVTGATFTWSAFGDMTLDGAFGLCTEVANPIFADIEIQCPIGPLGSGATTGIPVLRITPGSTGPLEVWATVGGPAGAVDADTDNNRLTSTFQVEAAVVADLAVSRLSEPAGPAKVGQLLEYGADVQNLGPDAVTGGTFTWSAFGDMTLDGVFGLCTEVANPIFADIEIQCPIGPLGSGAITGIPVLRITPESTGPLEVWASVGGPAGAVDPDTDNNRQTSTFQVEPAVVADLTTSARLTNGPGEVGASLEYAADVENLGPDAVTGATLTWVAFGDVTLGGLFGFCTEIVNPVFGNVAIQCPVDPIGAGQTDGIPVLQITPQSTGDVTVWATVSMPAGGFDPDADNNRATIVTPVSEPGTTFGGRVVFRSDRDGQWDLYIKDLATGDIMRLTNDAAQEGAPAWSPDGSRIAYHKPSDLHVINADGTGETRLTFNFNSFNPAWSPDGTELVYQDRSDGDWEIMVRRIADGVTRKLTDNTTQDLEPDWSGETIAFVRVSIGATGTLLTMSSVDGSGVTVVTGGVREPGFSPDGGRLTYTRAQAGAVWDVEVLTRSTGAIQSIEADGSRNSSPAFSPDGNFVVFGKNVLDGTSAVTNLWAVSADGSTPATAIEASAANDQSPHWR